MDNFIFQTTGTIINETGFSDRLGDTIKGLGAQRLLLITDPGIVSAGIAGKIKESLLKAGFEMTAFEKVEADPPEAVILEAVTMAKETRVDCVIGLGGGSSLDTAKLVAFLAISQQSLDDIYGVGMAQGKRLPLILIPTTAGTGSEVTPIAIVTTRDNQKMGVVSPLLVPDIALLDAELTVGLPPHVTAATGVDAMVHAIEAYTTINRKNPLSDMLAIKALELLSKNIRRAVVDGRNLESRSGMLLGSMLAGQAFANAPVAAVHALAYPIGGHFHVPHGLSNSLMLPHVMRFNAAVIPNQYAELAQIILLETATGTAEEISGCLIDWFEKLIAEIGLETKLSQVGIKEDHLAMLAEDAVKQERLLVNNPRVVTYEDAFAIYKAAL
ncbi:MAG: iron-containing alcohol dehydrogenase [Deltaproteobacteria bacterium]|nr:iron-containing alcohol dehydrogenase [Deltaproteobacteria bacterium]MBT7715635.1 iron-containing alcohol dehydrogenase [Deltaproteobacteria bacterium]